MRNRFVVASSFVVSLVAACSSTAPKQAPPSNQLKAAPTPASLPTLSLSETGIEANWMDPAADPCDSFFAYACGGFVKTTVIPADRATWGISESIQKSNEDFLHEILEKAAQSPGDDPVTKKIGDYYAACMDEAGINKLGTQPIKPLLDVIAKVKDFNSLATAVTALHVASVWPLFNISAQQDFKDATQMIAGLDQDGLGLPDRDYYLKNDTDLKDVRDFYVVHIGKMLALLGMSAKEIKVATADVMRIETKIAQLQQSKVTRRDPYQIYHRVDRDGLAQTAKTFPWNDYFKGLGVADVKAISVNDPAYFAGIDALMHQEKSPAWRHYLTWQLVNDAASILGTAFENEDFVLRQKLTGQKELAARWKRCVRSVDSQLGELLAQPYIAAKFAGDSKKRAAELVGDIHTVMRDEFAHLSWMDASTRRAAETKCDKMGSKVGYPDHWRDYNFAVSRTTHAANVLAAEQFDQKRNLAKVGKPVDRHEWNMTPPTVNAYYDPSLNEIVLPAGELQPPIFSADFYMPVNFGDEGASTVGHEMTHAFDDEGSQFDGNGNLRDWWSKDTKAKFNEATKCVQEQYSGYPAVPGIMINGALTSGENIADIGGVKLGYAALEEWKKTHADSERQVAGFSDEKLFFLAYAQGWCMKERPEYLQRAARVDPHSPARWRVDGPMSAVPEFAQAFQCQAGTKMHPPKVCSVW